LTTDAQPYLPQVAENLSATLPGRLFAKLRKLFCRHLHVELATTGPAFIARDRVMLPGVEVRCARCGEFWYAELDASDAMKAGLAQ
jgi:hypothetical protein